MNKTRPSEACFTHGTCNDKMTLGVLPTAFPLGGGRSHLFASSEIQPHLLTKGIDYNINDAFTFIDYVERSSVSSFPVVDGFVATVVPLDKLVPYIPVAMAQKIARYHDIPLGSHVPKRFISSYFANHNSECVACLSYCSIFKSTGFYKSQEKTGLKQSSSHSQKVPKLSSDDAHQSLSEELGSSSFVVDKNVSHVKDDGLPFPPPPLSHALAHTIIEGFCNDSSPESFEEAGCAVCGQLTPCSQLTPLKNVKHMLKVGCERSN